MLFYQENIFVYLFCIYIYLKLLEWILDGDL